MDKLIRRTRMVERQAQRRLARRRAAEERSERRDFMRSQKRVRQEVEEQLGAAIKARRQDWKLGPLAPRRDIGVTRFGRLHWGSISTARARPNDELPAALLETQCAWAGGSKYMCLAKGDRVAVVEGWLKGKIAVVNEIHKPQGTVSLGQVSRVNVTVPDYMLPEEAKGIDVHTVETHIPISAVRLVHPVKDEDTGVMRDAIIKELRAVNIHHDRPTRKVSWNRYVPGLNISIPWPKTEPPAHKDHPVDTLRIHVEEKSFVPTLLRPPMPDTVIDELRNQYSKFRTRHTDEYIAKKEAEVAEKARLASAEPMLTPLQELNRRQREERRARGQPVLSEEVLEHIGSVMARNRKRTLQGSGIGEIERGMGAVSLETPAEPPAETRAPTS